ncbi:hypothetical protein [Cohnella silvisoli]|uniref:Glycoside hydrolase family 2 catalytic domain-containing protein n=1 Tax=Cohnella silvisoli TaxID=2873699 RepID=A0ABV1KLQ9_9BACL|nr:hypothetical protein [Cohnella silvisoli]MCD9020624.1 hypothetical protein [Cohnella silvisoli]
MSQSSSGIDNVPSQDPHFLELLKETAIHALKAKRNHVSLACWSGGNELTDRDGRPATYEDENISLLKSLVEQYDPMRYFLPTSASGPSEFLLADRPGMNEDVHGPWKYAGPEEHYRLFNESDSLLHSEFGVDGCCSVQSMKRFLPEKDLAVTSVLDNLVWRHQGEWWDTLERSKLMFGEMADLEQLAAASQWVQAEGLRYALEANRRRKYRNSGSIVWQFNEPWPNVSCTSLVDYYGIPKLAYYGVRNAYRNTLLSLKYEKLIFRRGETFTASCYAHNSGKERSIEWEAECFDLNGRFLWNKRGSAKMEAQSAIKVADFTMRIEEAIPEIFAVRLKWDEAESNIYLFSTREESYFQPLLEVEKPDLDWSLADQTLLMETNTLINRYVVRNIGSVVALYVRPGWTEESSSVPGCAHYTVLLPGESRVFEVPERLDKSDPSSAAAQIKFMAWNDSFTTKPKSGGLK